MTKQDFKGMFAAVIDTITLRGIPGGAKDKPFGMAPRYHAPKDEVKLLTHESPDDTE